MQANIQVKNFCKRYITTISPISHLLTRLLELNEAYLHREMHLVAKKEIGCVGLVWRLKYQCLRVIQRPAIFLERMVVLGFVYEEY